MAVTTNFLTRGYVGAAQPVALVTDFLQGATTLYVTDLSGAGWSGIASSLAGDPGVFTIVIDYNEPTEEKVLCSGLDLIANTITVYTDGSTTGRGYDGTSEYDHTAPATTTTGNIFPVFTAQEASESNFASVASASLWGKTDVDTTPANILPNSGGYAGTSKYVASANHYHSLDTSTLNNILVHAYMNVNRTANWPAGAAGQGSSTGTTVPFDTVALAGGGFSSADNASGVITVHSNGIYRVTGCVQISNGNGNSALMIKSGSTVLAWGSIANDISTAHGVVINSLVSLTSGQTVNLALYSGGSTPASMDNAGTTALNALRNYLNVEFVSAV